MKKLNLNDLEQVSGGFGLSEFSPGDELIDTSFYAALEARVNRGDLGVSPESELGWVPVDLERIVDGNGQQLPVITPLEFRELRPNIRDLSDQLFREQISIPRHNSFRSRFLKR